MTQTQQQKTGDYGEQLALQHLQSKGYTIIATKWRCQRGEIDIIAERDAVYAFIEVKTRRHTTTEDAFMQITPRKRERLINAVHTYINTNDLEVNWRIDVIAIALPYRQAPIIEHVEDALDW